MLILEVGLVPCFWMDLAALVLRQTCLAVITEELESLDITALTVMLLESDVKVWQFSSFVSAII